MWSPTVFTKASTGVVCLIAAFIGCRHGASAVMPQPIQFKSVSEFKDFADANGLYLHSGTSSGNLVFPANNFYVADHAISLDDLDEVCSRRDCGLTPAWRGILWVCQIETTHGTAFPDQIDGKWRVWGNVMVVGDETLMDRIEAMHQAN
jgi:hypothetical protein